MASRGNVNKRFLYGYAGHALAHLKVRRGEREDCPELPPDPDDYPTITCPLCLEDKAFGEFESDHTPQLSGGSYFGESVVTVLTCAQCNRTASLKYEKRAGDLAKRARDLGFESSPLMCQCHPSPTVERLESGLLVHHDDTPRRLATMKSGFLLAFHILGYQWAASSALAPVREALLRGVLPPRRFGYVVGVNSDSDDLVVVDKRGPRPAVTVRGPGQYAVIFPGVGAKYAPEDPGGKARIYPWPYRPAGGKSINFLFAGGHLHHLDVCRRCEV